MNEKKTYFQISNDVTYFVKFKVKYDFEISQNKDLPIKNQYVYPILVIRSHYYFNHMYVYHAKTPHQFNVELQEK